MKQCTEHTRKEPTETEQTSSNDTFIAPIAFIPNQCPPPQISSTIMPNGTFMNSTRQHVQRFQYVSTGYPNFLTDSACTRFQISNVCSVEPNAFTNTLSSNTICASLPDNATNTASLSNYPPLITNNQMATPLGNPFFPLLPPIDYFRNQSINTIYQRTNLMGMLHDMNTPATSQLEVNDPKLPINYNGMMVPASDNAQKPIWKPYEPKPDTPPTIPLQQLPQATSWLPTTDQSGITPFQDTIKESRNQPNTEGNTCLATENGTAHNMHERSPRLEERSQLLLSLDDHLNDTEEEEALLEVQQLSSESLKMLGIKAREERKTGTLKQVKRRPTALRRTKINAGYVINRNRLQTLHHLDPPYRPPYRILKMKIHERQLPVRRRTPPKRYSKMLRSDVVIGPRMMHPICLCKKVKRSCLTRFLKPKSKITLTYSHEVASAKCMSKSKSKVMSGTRSSYSKQKLTSHRSKSILKGQVSLNTEQKGPVNSAIETSQSIKTRSLKRRGILKNAMAMTFSKLSNKRYAVNQLKRRFPKLFTTLHGTPIRKLKSISIEEISTQDYSTEEMTDQEREETLYNHTIDDNLDVSQSIVQDKASNKHRVLNSSDVCPVNETPKLPELTVQDVKDHLDSSINYPPSNSVPTSKGEDAHEDMQNKLEENCGSVRTPALHKKLIYLENISKRPYTNTMPPLKERFTSKASDSKGSSSSNNIGQDSGSKQQINTAKVQNTLKHEVSNVEVVKEMIKGKQDHFMTNLTSHLNSKFNLPSGTTYKIVKLVPPQTDTRNTENTTFKESNNVLQEDTQSTNISHNYKAKFSSKFKSRKQVQEKNDVWINLEERRKEIQQYEEMKKNYGLPNDDEKWNADMKAKIYGESAPQMSLPRDGQNTSEEVLFSTSDLLKYEDLFLLNVKSYYLLLF